MSQWLSFLGQIVLLFRSVPKISWAWLCIQIYTVLRNWLNCCLRVIKDCFVFYLQKIHIQQNLMEKFNFHKWMTGLCMGVLATAVWLQLLQVLNLHHTEWCLKLHVAFNFFNKLNCINLFLNLITVLVCDVSYVLYSYLDS